MPKDYRYSHVNSIWRSGDLRSFSQIFTIIPMYIVSADCGMNYALFARKVKSLGLFKLQELITISELTGIPSRSLVLLVADDMKEKGK